MQGTFRQVVGIDVAMNELVVSLAKTDHNLNVSYVQDAFANTKDGFAKLLRWTKKHASKTTPVQFVMEATGVYHEHLACFLDKKGRQVSIVLPSKISNFARSLDIKTVNDQTSSQAIALFGLQRQLEPWHMPDVKFSELRQLTRERERIVDQISATKNVIHAENKSAYANQATKKRTEDLLAFLQKQLDEVLKSINEFLKANEDIKSRVNLLKTIPGVGMITAATILAETNGFDLICNRRQLASYAGFDVREKSSGISVNMRPRISKRGNKHVRAAMYMPSLSAKRTNAPFAELYLRLLAKHGIKMKALVAVQRRLLELMYIIDKTGVRYDKNYEINKAAKAKTVEQPVLA